MKLDNGAIKCVVNIVLNKWKKTFEKIFRPIGRGIAKLPISPNSLTLIGLVIMLISGYYIIIHDLFLGVIFLVLSSAFDMFDGLVARIKGRVSDFGGVLDSMADRYEDGILLISLIYGGFIDLLWGLIALLGFLLVSYSRAKGEILGIKMSGVGILERAERLLIIMLAIIITIIYPSLMIVGFSILNITIIILAIVAHISVLQRVIYIKRQIESRSKKE